MPRVSITIEDGPNAGEWSAEYKYNRKYEEMVLSDIDQDGVSRSFFETDDEVLDLLEAKAREAYSADLAAAKADQGDFRREQKEDGD